MDQQKTELDVKRTNFVNNIISKYPKMKVHYMNLPNKDGWKTERFLDEIFDDELEIFNLRKSFPNEIILDVEEKYKLIDIKEKLKKKNWTFEIWDTGSRGFHISLMFDNLEDKPLDLRNRIREYVIKEFETDLRLAKESQWLALEYSQHFKTLNHKILVERTESATYNHISDDIIKFCQEDLKNKKNNILIADEDFKDLYKTEPYLKWALANKIEDGGRNDVLFKNLAVLLVRGGLSNEDIVKVAQVVVNNCPGKNLAEFLGWVNKCRDGQLREFNKFELVSWSLKFNHPVLYEIVDDSEYVSLLSIKQLWDIIWENKISSQPIWKDLAFYNMLSCLVDEREDDLRCHVIFSSYSSTGKDEGLNLIEDTLKGVDYQCFRPGEATDRTLVGSINQFAIEHNTKNDLSEDNPTNGKHTYKDPKEEGILSVANWVAFGEAESVFRPGAHNQKVQLYLRQAMDKRRQIEKGVGGIILKFNTNATFCLTTYRMDDIIMKILHNGLFQRALFYNKDISEEDHKKIVKHINRHRFDPNIKEKYDEKKYMAVLVDKLKTTKLWYDENKSKIKYFKDCKTMIDLKWDELDESFNTLVKADKEILQSIVRRNSNNLFKLTKLTAVANMREEIDANDINYCFDLVGTCISSTRNLLMGVDKRKKVNYGILNLVKTPMSKMNLYRAMSEMLNIRAPATQKKILNSLEIAEYVSVEKQGNLDMVVITEKGRAQLGAEDDI